jgi:hypothetical protein
MEPLEVIRDMLLDPNARTKFNCIGGAPQMVKVYKSLNRVSFGVKWKIEGKEVITLFGRPIKTFRSMPLPVIDPITLKYSILILIVETGFVAQTYLLKAYSTI